MVLAHGHIVVWAPLSKDFCVIFQNAKTHKLNVLEDKQHKNLYQWN